MEVLDPLKHARSELKASQSFITLMENSTEMEEYEAHWRSFLNSIEKCWVKVERSCQPFANKFVPWQAQFHSLRRKDMLLRYLKQARDADNHSIQEIAKIEPGSTSFTFVNPAGGHIKHMQINNAGVIRYEGDPMIVAENPPMPVAVPVKNSGSWYNPPTSHLGKPIKSAHPTELAHLGHRFYRGYLEQVERKFFAVAP